MKRFAAVMIAVVLLISGCSGEISLAGSWKTRSASEMGLNISGGFVDTVTSLTFTEEGTGAWEIELVASRQILRREFTYTLEGRDLTITFPDNTVQKFTVSMEKGTLNLTGLENYSLTRVK